MERSKSHSVETPLQAEQSSLSLLLRFYIYGIHGFGIEIMFTAAWEFVVNLNWKLPGVTSVWSFFIYGISTVVIERMYLSMRHSVPLPVRALIYTLWSYAWEFATGYVLKQFDACPWDYTLFEGDFMGLVTLEYAPLWYLACIFGEQIIIKKVHKLYSGPCYANSIVQSANGCVKSKSS